MRYICKNCGETVEELEASNLEYICPTCNGYLLPESEYRDYMPNTATNNTNEVDYNKIHLRLSVYRNRNEMVEKLLIEELGTITNDDIIDTMIDLELYNKNCRRQKIARVYKERKKNNEN